MTLFNEVSDKTMKLIQDNSDIVEKNIESWINSEKLINTGITGKVLQYMTVAKRRNNPKQIALKCNPSRLRKVERLVREGYVFVDFKLVIDHMISIWEGSPTMHKNITPETIFASENFTKYYEDAASNNDTVLKAGPEKSISGNQYDTLIASK